MLAVFDDRVEVWSTGTFPEGIRPKMLSREPKSVLRNSIIADVFNRAGLIEKWGRGTNRVIDMCRTAGIAPPEFDEIAGAAVVRFRVNVLGARQTTPQVTPQVGPQVKAVRERARHAASAEDLQGAAGLKDRVHFLRSYLQPLLAAGWMERTIPEKPRSRMQRYRTTEAGKAALEELGPNHA